MIQSIKINEKFNYLGNSMWFCVLEENKKIAENLDWDQIALCKKQKDYLNINGVQIQRYN